MPAINTFPKHTNPQALRAGLVLQPKPDTNTNEFGLEEGTFQFITFNENLKRFQPKRGTGCASFIAGDDLTARILKKEFPHLGAQTAKKIRSGHCPGIGILEVQVMGAIFDVLDGVYPFYDTPGLGGTGELVSPAPGVVLDRSGFTFRFRHNWQHFIYIGTTENADDLFSSNTVGDSVDVSNIPIAGAPIYVTLQSFPPGLQGDPPVERYVFETAAVATEPSPDDPYTDGAPFGPITTPFRPVDSTLQNVVIPLLDFTQGNIPDSNLRLNVLIDYHAVDLKYEYVARDFSHRPRFLKSSYSYDPGFLFDADDRKLKLLIDNVRIDSTGSVTLENPPAELVDVIRNPQNHWEDKLSLIGTGSQFSQVPAGQFWHVTETTQVQLVPAPVRN